jgi:hypothetical protein
MRVETIPFPRQFGPGAKGYDVLAVKHGLSVALGGVHGMALKDDTFGKAAQEALADWKLKVGLLHDPEYTSQAHRLLTPSFNAHDAALMVKEAGIIAAERLRSGYVATHRWFIAHAHLVHYDQLRPIDESLTPFETTQEIYTDCSGEIELAAKWTPGCPDPSGLGFNGEGNTGSLRAHCLSLYGAITAGRVLPGDLGWFGAPNDTYGEHAITFLSAFKDGDAEVASNGYVGDPIAHTFKDVASALAEGGFTQVLYLRFLPAP